MGPIIQPWFLTRFKRLPLTVFFAAVCFSGTAVWGAGQERIYRKPPLEEIKKNLTAEQFKVTQEMGTETPFKNAFWDQKAEGLYVDVVTGEPLFSSADKFDSGTGWPSFTRPLTDDVLTRHEDRGFLSVRTEVKSKIGGSHLGHVFNDGPAPSGLRYCINSASLRFIPAGDLEKVGYGRYRTAFAADKPASPTSSVTSSKVGGSETGDTPTEKALFAGGCFWCMEAPFDQIKGVRSVIPGYSGGPKANPTYEEVSKGGTGHYEVVEVTFDPKLVTYEQLLKIFWLQIDPLDAEGQFCDRGSQYRAGIFTNSPQQRLLATESKNKWQRDPRFAAKKIVTEILDAGKFFPAEDYHQKYYIKNPIRYKYYRNSCGRDQRLKQVWD